MSINRDDKHLRRLEIGFDSGTLHEVTSDD